MSGGIVGAVGAIGAIGAVVIAVRGSAVSLVLAGFVLGLIVLFAAHHKLPLSFQTFLMLP